MDKLSTIQTLIARAVDTAASEEEQRTSALLAVRMLAKYGFQVGGEATRARYEEPAKPQEPAAEPYGAPKAAEPKKPYRPSGRRYYGAPKRVTIEARYGGCCAHCGERYQENDRISWCKGEATYHAACYEEAAA